MKQAGQKLSQSGSFFNYLMSHNQTIPVVGEGATELMYSDRRAYEVLEVSKNGKQVIIDRYQPKRVDRNGMSECQDYEYKDLAGQPKTLVYRYNNWYEKFEKIEFTQEYYDKLNRWQDHFKTIEERDEWHEQFYDENDEYVVVEGYSYSKTCYSKINVIFGVKKEYYDFSF